MFRRINSESVLLVAMSQTGYDKLLDTTGSQGVSGERQKLIREAAALRKQLEHYQRSEEKQVQAFKALELRVDELERDKYKLIEEGSSLRCDLNLKESENKRLMQRLDQVSKQCVTLTERYNTQKQKIDTIIQHEKEFFKALQEVIDYYYESLMGFSRFHLKSMYKLMVGEPLSIYTDLREDFVNRHKKLAILNASLEIPTIKISKKVLFKNIHQRVAFFQDLDFDKMQLTFDRILEEMKRSGLKIEAHDMNMSSLMDTKQSSRLQKKGSAMGNPEDELNESVGDINTSQTMFLSDLEKSDIQLAGNGVIRSETFGSLGDCLKALKDRIKNKPTTSEGDKQGIETIDLDMVSRAIRDMSEMVEFLNSNLHLSPEDRKASTKSGLDEALSRHTDVSTTAFTITPSKNELVSEPEEHITPDTISHLVQGTLDAKLRI